MFLFKGTYNTLFIIVIWGYNMLGIYTMNTESRGIQDIRDQEAFNTRLTMGPVVKLVNNSIALTIPQHTPPCGDSLEAQGSDIITTIVTQYFQPAMAYSNDFRKI